MRCDGIAVFPLTNGNGCTYNVNTTAQGGMTMERMTIDEALEIFDQLTDEDKEKYLAYLREKNEGAA